MSQHNRHTPATYPTTRRSMLRTMGAGFGTVGMLGALQQSGLLAGESTPIHFPAKAKRVVFLFMNGAPSHVDTFDPKPALEKYAGEQPDGKLYKPSKGSGYMPSPFKFAAHGESGVVMSELLPELSKHADDLCVLRSMHTNVPNHEPGLLMMNSGNIQPIRPSLGSWLSYGLGSVNENLPAFVTLCPGLPVVGPQLWSNSFLPGEHQGVSIDTNHTEVEKLVANLKHPTLSRPQQREQLDLVQAMNRLHREGRQHDQQLDAHIKAMELAFEMQREASVAFDLNQETDETKSRYGDSVFARSCLLARRLLEHDVRMVQVYYVTKSGKQPWDTHKKNNDSHRRLCADSDKATAALLTDLKDRDMLKDTLVIWGGEFGRTPYAQGKDFKDAGRDHHHTGFSMFLAGGGVRGGLMYGTTDELGLNAEENRIHVHDLHATVLHQLGIDHERLTYRYSGRDFRLTDVHGRVVQDILS